MTGPADFDAIETALDAAAAALAAAHRALIEET